MAERKSELRRRIQTVANMAEFTHALYLVSAVRMQRAQQALRQATPYIEKAEEIGHRVTMQSRWQVSHPLFDPRPINRIAIIVVGTERRLCGGCSAAPVRTALRLAGDLGLPGIYITVGSVAAKMLAEAGVTPLRHFEIPERITLRQASQIAEVVISSHLAQESDAAVIVCNRFESLLFQAPEALPLLPLVVHEGENTGVPSGPRTVWRSYRDEYYVEPGIRRFLDGLLPHLVAVRIYEAILQSKVSEHAARMTAMRGANHSASELHETLQSQFRALRQASLTNETRDVSTAAEALRYQERLARKPRPVISRRKIKPVEVRSAVPLSEEEKQGVKAWLYQRFGLNLDFSWTVDDSLIGGLQARVGDVLVDYSVAKQLRTLQDKMKVADASRSPRRTS